jgi:hypothetical protein
VLESLRKRKKQLLRRKRKKLLLRKRKKQLLKRKRKKLLKRRRREDSITSIFQENFNLKFSFSYLFQKDKTGFYPVFFIVLKQKVIRF